MNLGRGTETLEFKRTTGELKEAIDSIVAILNKHHKGDLYFGIKPDGTPAGQQITEKTLRDISQGIHNHIEPEIFPEIKTVNFDGCECIHVRFEGYRAPYFSYNVARIRVADEDRVMSPAELQAYFERVSNKEEAWEKNISPLTVEDVEDEKVKNYIQRGQAADRIRFDYTDKETALKKLYLLNGSHLLNAGMVLFCESGYSVLQMAVFAGTERLTFLDLQKVTGTIFDLVDQAEKYIMSNIHWRVQFDGSLQRKEIPEIPKDAVREALINSFCHKDYGACQNNEVAIYKDRVEIYNPGSFPDGFTPEDFITGSERPIRRNPLITSVLYYSRDVESFGTGLKRIVDSCNKAGCKVEFKILKSGFVVVFYRSLQDLNDDAGMETVYRPQDSPYDNPQVTPYDNNHDSPQDRNDRNEEKVSGSTEDYDPKDIKSKILIFCSVPRKKAEIAEYVGLKDIKSFSKRYLKPLLESGRLRMTIPDKPQSKYQKYITVRH